MRSLVLALSLAFAGLLVGLGLFTFRYAKGFSYLSDDPKVCVNCHIMQPQYESWQKSSHHHVAVCVDCHLPHDFIGKYTAKALNGYSHSSAFTLQNFPEPIHLTPRNADILETNCRTCHQQMSADITKADTHHSASMSCLHCHYSAGHGPRASMGKNYLP